MEARPLGRGGFAEVFRATHRGTGVVVALKRVRTGVPQAAARMKREIETMHRLAHPHVMPLVNQDALFRWYCMPVACRTFSSLPADVDVDEVVVMLDQVGAALAHAHRLGVLHRDITPTNILDIGTPGSPSWVLADWGLVSAPVGADVTALTEGPMGTRGFMAPEVQVDGRWSACSDIYALAMVVRAKLASSGSISDPRIKEFLSMALKPDPESRPGTVDEALRPIRPAREDGRRRFLVWRVDRGAVRTDLIELQPGTTPSVLGTRRGLHCSDGVRLWSLVRGSQPVRTPDWEHMREAGFPEGESRHVSRSLKAYHMERFDTGDRRRVSPVEPRPGSVLEHDLDFDLSPDGGAGTILLIRLFSRWYGGGAHGGSDVRFFAIDVSREGELEGLSDLSFVEASDLRARARELALSDEEFFVDDDSPVATCWRPVHESREDGAVERVEVQFTYPVCYAASDGAWASYTKSARLRTEVVPGSIALPAAPPALIPVLAELAGSVDAYGWSPVEGEVEWAGWFTGGPDEGAVDEGMEDPLGPISWM